MNNGLPNSTASETTTMNKKFAPSLEKLEAKLQTKKKEKVRFDLSTQKVEAVPPNSSAPC